jgi:hypothetical protein
VKLSRRKKVGGEDMIQYNENAFNFQMDGITERASSNAAVSGLIDNEEYETQSYMLQQMNTIIQLA